jgi:hypothetical protein
MCNGEDLYGVGGCSQGDGMHSGPGDDDPARGVNEQIPRARAEGEESKRKWREDKGQRDGMGWDGMGWDGERQ